MLPLCTLLLVMQRLSINESQIGVSLQPVRMPRDIDAIRVTVE